MRIMTKDGTLAETEARAKQIDEDCSSRLSARIDAVAWRVPNCMVVLTNMKAVAGYAYGVTHMKLSRLAARYHFTI